MNHQLILCYQQKGLSVWSIIALAIADNYLLCFCVFVFSLSFLHGQCASTKIITGMTTPTATAIKQIDKLWMWSRAGVRTRSLAKYAYVK